MIASVHYEKTHLKKLMMIKMMMIVIINKSQGTTVFSGPETDFCNETEARTVMVDFKFDALYR